MSIPTILSETALYRRLKELVDEPYQLEAGERNRRAALSLVDAVTGEAATLMARAATRFPEYTLHDEVHLRRVAHLMGTILHESGTLERLSYIEVVVLLLSAYLHDVGMVPSEEKLAGIVESEAFILFRAGKRDERAGLRELEGLLATTPSNSPESVKYRRKIGELELGILTEYLRINHGDAGWVWIRETYGADPRWVLEGQNVADLVAWVCRGHAFHPYQLTAEYRAYFPVEKLISQTPVNVLYCTLILRLADILDFDRERTPTVLFENISPRNEVSLQEWNKHRAITGWRISRDRILFQAECTHPAYEKAIREFLDAIDGELQTALNIVRTFPSEEGISERYRLTLPPVVDRSRVGAKDNAYTYVDLAFTLSHQDIMKLLMGPDFWGGPSLAVRELIQNAYDAIRHRQALERAAGNEWNAGKIILRQRLNDEGRLELSCEDNGIGMTRHHLEKYFFRVGKSYYRSPEFERERAGLRGRGADFDPVSQFGLGVVSTFMIGDRLHVRTQRYVGPNLGCDEALEVDVEGSARIVVMRTVHTPVPSPGTRVTVFGKKIGEEDEYVDFSHSFNLHRAVRYLAAALDVPIEVVIAPSFEAVNELIAPRPRPLQVQTEVERTLPLDSFFIAQKDIADVFTESEGTARMLFLVDSTGRVTIDNKTVRWKLDKRGLFNRLDVALQLGRRAIKGDELESGNYLAQDGITVASRDLALGLSPDYSYLHHPPEIVRAGMFFINLRGSDKLPLQPNRQRYADNLQLRPEERQWANFRHKASGLFATIFEQVLLNERTRPIAAELWPLIEIHNINVNHITRRSGFLYLPLPAAVAGTEWKWLSLQELRALGVEYLEFYQAADQSEQGYVPDTAQIRSADFSFRLDFDESSILQHLEQILRACTALAIVQQQARYQIIPEAPFFQDLGATQRKYSDFDSYAFQMYTPELQEYYTVQNPLFGINILHPAAGFLARQPLTPYTRRDPLVKSLEQLSILGWVDEFATKDPAEWTWSTCAAVRTIARCWEEIDWLRVAPEIQPPYRLFYPTVEKAITVTFEMIRALDAPAAARILELAAARPEKH